MGNANFDYCVVSVSAHDLGDHHFPGTDPEKFERGGGGGGWGHQLSEKWVGFNERGWVREGDMPPLA